MTDLITVRDYAVTVVSNNISQSSFSNAEKVESFRYFGISIALFSIFAGTIGNLLTILAYFSNRKLQTTFNLLVVNLSVVDFITASLMLPFNLAGYVQLRWPFGNDSFTARLQAYSYFCCGYTSIVFLVAITVNRFIGVFWPSRYEDLFRVYRKFIVLIFCWLFAPIMLLPFLLGTDPSCKTTNHALTGFRTDQILCTFICLPHNGWEAYMQVTRILFQFIPLAVMVVLYIAIFVNLHQKARKLERTMTRGLRSASETSTAIATASAGLVGRPMLVRQASSQSNLLKTATTKRKSSMAETRRQQNNKRMLIISVVICFAFTITFLPSVIVNLLPGRTKFDPRVHMAASNFTWFNSSLNPIVYVILNPRFRKEYIRLIKLLFGKTKAKFVHDSSTASVKNRQNNGSSTPRKGSIASNATINQIAIPQFRRGSGMQNSPK